MRDCEICGDEPDDPEDLVPCATCDWLMCASCTGLDGNCKECTPNADQQTDRGAECAPPVKLGLEG